MGKLKQYSKGITALIGALIVIANTAWGDQAWITAVAAVLSTLGVYQIPNAPAGAADGAQ